jgi:hypothetical protein
MAEDKRSVFVLTMELDDYDQVGPCFITVFFEKPTIEQLMGCGIPKNECPHVLDGGGRLGDNDAWWNLEEFTEA